MRPLDIQRALQGIQTLVNLRELHPRALTWPSKWRIGPSPTCRAQPAIFCYDKYPFITNKTPPRNGARPRCLPMISMVALEGDGHSIPPLGA